MRNTKVDVDEPNDFQFTSVRVFSDEFEKAHLKNVSRTVKPKPSEISFPMFF